MRYLYRFNYLFLRNACSKFNHIFVSIKLPIFHDSSCSQSSIVAGFKTLESTFFHASSSSYITFSETPNSEERIDDVNSIVSKITEMIRTENTTIHLSDKTRSEISISEKTKPRTSQVKPRIVSPFDRRTARILETENPTIKHSERTSNFEETHMENPQPDTQNGNPCNHKVAEIIETEKSSISEETRLKNIEDNAQDVSPIVHRITEIIRTENPSAPMEDCLENSGFLCDPGIVEKVLKRCFKVGQLALRFFNWVKLQPGFQHTTETYNCMIYIAGEAKEFNLVKKLVEEMDAELCPKNIKTWTILVAQYGKAKLLSQALQAFGQMKKSGIEPDVEAYKSIISILCNSGKTELAMEFYKEMVWRSIQVDLDLYKLLLKSLSHSGNIDAVRLVGDDMMKIAQISELEVDSCILKFFCVSGRIREALELVKTKKLSNYPGNLQILIKGLCRAGRLDHALELSNIMKQSYGFDREVYEILINGYLKKGETAKVFELLSDLKEYGYKPTAPTYTAIIQHLFKLNEYEKACRLYDEMLENGLEPDVVAITAIVAGHVRHGHISKAFEAFEGLKMKGRVPTQKAYSVFIQELCKVSKSEEAFKLLNDMWNSKLCTGHETSRLVISSLRKKGKLEEAQKIEQMSRTFRLCDLEPINNNHFSSKGIDAAKNIVEIPDLKLNGGLESNHMQLENTNLLLLEPLRKGYREHDLQEACRILSCSYDWTLMQEALEKSSINFSPELVMEILRNCKKNGNSALRFFSWVGQLDGFKHTTETYNMAIKISGSAKDFTHMRNLYGEMRRNCSVTANTWTIILTQYGRAGLTEIALKKFKDMKADKCIPNRSTYKYLIIFLCERKGQKVDEAMKIFREMMVAGFMPDKELVDIYLTCLCESGKLLEARKCIDSLCKSCFTSQICYSLLVKALCRNGRVDEALGLADEAGSVGFKVDQYIYGSLVHGLLRGGRLHEALAKVEAMKQAGILPTVHVYTSLIVHFLKEKKIRSAEEILTNMKEEGCDPTVVTYSAMIRGYMNEDRVSDAWNVFLDMKLNGPFPDFRTYSMFISCLCKVGRSEESLQLIHEMMESGICPSTINFRNVFYGLNREGCHLGRSPRLVGSLDGVSSTKRQQNGGFTAADQTVAASRDQDRPG